MTEKELLNWIKGYCTAILGTTSNKDEDISENSRFVKPIIDKILEYESTSTSGKQLLNEQLSAIVDARNKVWYTTVSNEVAMDAEQYLKSKIQSEK